MIGRRIRLAVLGTLLLALPAAGQEALQSGREKMSPALRRALGAASSSMRVIVRMRGSRVATAVGATNEAMRLAMRRDEARRTASDVLRLLGARAAQAMAYKAMPHMPGAPRSSVIGDSRGASTPRPQELWITNSICVDATPDIIRELASRSDVERVYRDIRIQAIPRPELARGKADAGPAALTEASNWGLEKMQIRKVWDLHGLRGEGVVVGQIDTGVDASHPALAGKVLRFRDFVNGKSAAYDDEGHGTHTAGIICAGGEGIGVAPGARLVVAKALDSDGSGELSRLLAAMQWMLDPDGDPGTNDRPVCVSNSWGVDRKQMRELGSEETFFWDAVQAWRDANILPVFASGNNGPSTECLPGGYPIALAVGATDRADSVPYFSTGGRTTWNGISYTKPDVGAPGYAIVSTVPGNKLQSLNGTSMACPQAAGVIALLKQARPTATANELESLLTSTATDLGAQGRDDRYGMGRLDALAAVSAALRVATPAPPVVQPPAPSPSPAPARPPAGSQPNPPSRQIARNVLLLLAGLAAALGLTFFL